MLPRSLLGGFVQAWAHRSAARSARADSRAAAAATIPPVPPLARLFSFISRHAEFLSALCCVPGGLRAGEMTSSCGIRQWAGLITEPRLSVALFPSDTSAAAVAIVSGRDSKRTRARSNTQCCCFKRRKEKKKSNPRCVLQCLLYLVAALNSCFVAPFFHVLLDCELS